MEKERIINYWSERSHEFVDLRTEEQNSEMGRKWLSEIEKNLPKGRKLKILDAEKPEFPDATFDVVVSRNLTWTLPHAEEAYREWTRVLKKGGVLLNFDADYGHDDFTRDEEKLPPEHAHCRLKEGLVRRNVRPSRMSWRSAESCAPSGTWKCWEKWDMPPLRWMRLYQTGSTGILTSSIILRLCLH